MSRDQPSPTPPPAACTRPVSLFLDFDGTLVELADTPDRVIVGRPMLSLLDALAAALDGRVVIVSGRSVEQLDAFLGPAGAGLGMVGSHGLEARWPGEAGAAPVRDPALAAATERATAFAANWPGMMVEHKSFGVGLHYRLAPGAEAAAIGFARAQGAELGLAVQLGKMMAELRPPGDDKGHAVAAAMRRPGFAGSIPLFLGDDLTDEPGFVAAQALGGAGVLVGPPRETAARHALPDVAAVHRWLGGLIGEPA